MDDPATSDWPAFSTGTRNWPRRPPGGARPGSIATFVDEPRDWLAARQAAGSRNDGRHAAEATPGARPRPRRRAPADRRRAQRTGPPRSADFRGLVADRAEPRRRPRARAGAAARPGRRRADGAGRRARGRRPRPAAVRAARPPARCDARRVRAVARTRPMSPASCPATRRWPTGRDSPRQGMGAVIAHHVALAAPQRLLVFGRGGILALVGHDPAQGSPPSPIFNHEGGSVPLRSRPSWNPARAAGAEGGFVGTLARMDGTGMKRPDADQSAMALAAARGRRSRRRADLRAGLRQQRRRSDYFRARGAAHRRPAAAQPGRPRLLPRPVRRDQAQGLEPGPGHVRAERADGPLHAGRASPNSTSPPIRPRSRPRRSARWLPDGPRPAAGRADRQPGRQARDRRRCPRCPARSGWSRCPPPPKRLRPRSIDDGTMPAAIADAHPLAIKNDDPTGARAAARRDRRRTVRARRAPNGASASPGASTSRTTTPGATPWRAASPTAPGRGSAEGWWTAGLAAWRLGDCEEAAEAFQQAPPRAPRIPISPPPAITGRAARWLRCRAAREGRRQRCAPPPQRDETLYGMLAAEQLGLKAAAQHAYARFQPAPTGRACAISATSAPRSALAEIGEDDLADEVLRHQARIGDPRQYPPLSRLARDLGLPSTQLWMAYNAPRRRAPGRGVALPDAASGPRSAAGRSIRRWSMPMRCRNRTSAPAWSARPGASGLMQITPDHACASTLPSLSMDAGRRSI